MSLENIAVLGEEEAAAAAGRQSAGRMRLAGFLRNRLAVVGLIVVIALLLVLGHLLEGPDLHGAAAGLRALGGPVERRVQVFTTFLSLALFSASIFTMRCASTNGPFLVERPITSQLLAFSFQPSACPCSSCLRIFPSTFSLAAPS